MLCMCVCVHAMLCVCAHAMLCVCVHAMLCVCAQAMLCVYVYAHAMLCVCMHMPCCVCGSDRIIYGSSFLLFLCGSRGLASACQPLCTEPSCHSSLPPPLLSLPPSINTVRWFFFTGISTYHWVIWVYVLFILSWLHKYARWDFFFLILSSMYWKYETVKSLSHFTNSQCHPVTTFCIFSFFPLSLGEREPKT